MKIFIATIIALAICLIGFNVFRINWEDPLDKDSSVALIGIVASLCAVVLMLILHTSRKIAQKLKE